MADGDAAAAAGLDIVAGSADRRDGYKEINKTRDYVADNITRLATLPRREAVGQVNTPALAAGGTATITITYPAGRFTIAPGLFISTADGRVTPTITANTTTGATFILGNFTSGSSPARTGAWHAVQMTPTSAAG